MQILLNSTIKVYDAIQASAMLAKVSYPFPAEWPKVNSLFNPLGPSPARAYLLLLRKDLDTLDLDSGSFKITFKDNARNEISANSMLISREPQCVHPGGEDDDNALYLVEFSDVRHLLQGHGFSFPIQEHYNVRAPAYGTDRYDDSGNSGSAWTWDTMTQDVWNTMSSLLGTYPSLPWTPTAPPEDWKFPGVSAWKALSQILHRVGCAVAWDPTATSNQYSIVRIGASDTAYDTAITDNADKVIYDRQYLAIKRGKLPRKVRVYFPRKHEDYGTERTVPKDATQWTTVAGYTKDITKTTTTGTDANTIHHVSDDLPALFDAAGTHSNSSACDTRAQERADDFYRMVEDGGGRLHKVYTGLVTAFEPASKLKGVAWRQDLTGYGSGMVGGLVTEIINHPYWQLAVQEHVPNPLECWGASKSSIALQAPDLGPTYPLYPHLLEIVELTTGTADGNGNFTAKLEIYDPDARTYTDTIDIYARDINGLTTLTSGLRFHGRLTGMETDRPIYQIDGGAEFNLTVEEDDGSPSYTNINKIQFEADNFTVTQPGARQAKIDIKMTVEEVDGSPSVTKVHTLRFDQDDGFVITNPSAGIARVDLPINLDMGAKVEESDAQTVTAGNEAILTSDDTELWDTHSFHSVAASTGRMTFATGGNGRYVVSYRVLADVTFASDSGPKQIECYAKLGPGGTEIAGSRICGPVWQITAKIGTAETTITQSHLCLTCTFKIWIADFANEYIEIFGVAPAGIADTVFDEFVFSVHKLNRAGVIAT